MARGIVLVEARSDGETMRLLGGFWVVTEDAARRIFTGEAGEAALKWRCAYVEPEVVKRLGLREVKATETEATPGV
jgi:hypothetical protein